SKRFFGFGLTVLSIASTVWAAGKGPIQIRPPRIFPFVINQPGSYQLIGNLTVANGASAIQINASNVTLDLNGFTVQGDGGGFVSGINSSNASQRNITIRNGVVRGFSSDGVKLVGGGNVISDVKVEGNGINGIDVFQGSLVEHCVATGNGLNGINASQDCSI